MERGGTDESRATIALRRLWTIPRLVLGLVIVTVLLPVALPVALAVDLVRWVLRRRPFMALRLTAFLWAFLAIEVAGVLRLLYGWLASGFGLRRQALLDRTWNAQQFWAGGLFAIARRLFGLKLVVEGDEHVEPGPLLVLVRHASIVDNLLPSVTVVAPHRLVLRYVLKRELLSNPCLDIGARRLPNYFVRRDTGEQVERDAIARLATDLGPSEGVLLFPEGTRFTPERRERALARIAERDPALAERAAQIENLLPPRVGGVLAVLDAAPQVDVLVVAHHGFDGLRLISDIWAGALVGRTIRVRLSRIPRSEVPEGRDERIGWLHDVWLDVDRWVAAQGAP